MIAADTSSFSNFLKREGSADADLVRKALTDGNLVLSPVVVAELFSSPNMTDTLKAAIRNVPVLELLPGFWERVGINRATLLRAGKNACLADSMIAASCLDHGIEIIAPDSDYRHFEEHFGLVVRSGVAG